MVKIISKNIANFIVLFRVLLIALVVLCLNIESYNLRVWGLFLLIVAVILDGVDGYIARKLNIASTVGGLLDTLGDRITENVMIVFLAYKGLFPVGIAIFFIFRSFISDFIRTLNFRKGIGTFSVNKSLLGKIFVSSVSARVFYLLLKIALFIGGCYVLIITSPGVVVDKVYLISIIRLVYNGAYIVLAFNFIRFVFLVYDSRNILKEEFYA